MPKAYEVNTYQSISDLRSNCLSEAGRSAVPPFDLVS